MIILNNINKEELNSIDTRLNNLIYRLSYPKMFKDIIKCEKLDIDTKIDYTTSDYIKKFQKLDRSKKEQILLNWECGYRPVIQTNWIDKKLEIREIEEFLKNNSKEIEEKFNIYIIRINSSSNSIEGCFLGKKSSRYQFIDGKIQETQPTYYIYLRYSQLSNIIQFLTPETIGSFRKYLITGLKKDYRYCKLGLNKDHIMGLANEAFAKNAKIECIGEEIHERGLSVPENKNLFSIAEFINLIKKDNYIIRKIFVTLNLKTLRSPYNQIFIRIFPNQGRISFTRLVNEEQISETLKIIQKIRSSKPVQGKNRLMDEFLKGNRK